LDNGPSGKSARGRQRGHRLQETKKTPLSGQKERVQGIGKRSTAESWAPRERGGGSAVTSRKNSRAILREKPSRRKERGFLKCTKGKRENCGGVSISAKRGGEEKEEIQRSSKLSVLGRSQKSGAPGQGSKKGNGGLQRGIRTRKHRVEAGGERGLHRGGQETWEAPALNAGT